MWPEIPRSPANLVRALAALLPKAQPKATPPALLLLHGAGLGGSLVVEEVFLIQPIGPCAGFEGGQALIL